VGENEVVKAGDPIGLGGNTGRSTGPHLHFETRLLGKALNPAWFFDFPNQDVTGDYYLYVKPKKKVYDPSDPDTYYKVRSGDTLSKIAKKYGTTVKNIKRWSGIKSDKLRVGQRLIVGWDNGEPKASSAKKSTASKSKSSYHKVRKGETLSTISRKYGVTVKRLKSANNLKGDNIQEGQKLVIP
jgi:LysM repeat protein